MIENENLRLAEVANEVGISYFTLWGWASKGFIPAFKPEPMPNRINRPWFIKRSDLELVRRLATSNKSVALTKSKMKKRSDLIKELAELDREEEATKFVK